MEQRDNLLARQQV
uniref:Uncharacterized protein n=1 Tax=Anguilla anguilla TaxID=7936 RepID=A0A0E9QV57_ANGAN